jgi:hypothetical protein
MARPARFELATLCLEGRRSIHLSYGRIPFLTSLLYYDFHRIFDFGYLSCRRIYFNRQIR